MARGSYQAGSVSVNLNANSAQYVQALKHAQQITNACLSNMSQTFKHFASTAMLAGATVGRVTSFFAGPMAKAALYASGTMVTYTGVVIAHRLEQQKLAIQYGATAEQMNQMAYVANYAGVELEDVLDAMKEFSIKAGDAVEAGGVVTNTMSAFYKAAGGAQMWNNETSPVVKLNKLREAFQNLSDSDKLRVLDEAGDAGLRLNGVLRLTNQEMDMLQKTGAATATAANMTNMQTLIAKFGYLQQVGNDFLMGIVGRIAPVLIKVVDQWTNKLRSAFEDKGGFKEGFQSYVDLWAKRIFDFLMETIESVAKFMDTLSNLKFDVLSAYNNVKATMPGYSTVSATYDPSKLSKEQLQDETKLNQLYKDREKIDRERIAREKAIRGEYIKTHGAAAGITDKLAHEYQIGNLVKEDKALQIINKRLEETRAKIEPLAAGRLSINAAQAVDRKDNEHQEIAKKNITDPARKAFEEAMKNKPKDEKAPESKGKPHKGLTEQVYAASQSAANASSTDKLNENWEAYKKKLEAQREEVLQIMQKYDTKEISEIEKREQEETKTLNDAYKGMKDIVTDYYADKLKSLNKNSPAYIQATKEMNDKVKAVETERVEAVRRLDESQQKRRITDLNRMTKDIERKRKDMERQYGYGEGGNETEHERGRREIGEQYDEMLDEMRDKFGKHLDDKNSMEYKKFVELQEQKKRAQEEYDKAELEKFWEQQDAKNTIGNMIANIKGSGESPFPGTSNKEVQQAKDNTNAQVKLVVGGGETILANAAKNNKKAFEMKKKMDIATAIMSTYNGATAALAWGWPMGPIFAALTVAMGMMNVAQIKSQQWTGQAHDGIDYVPNEGTWNLQKGERVLGPALNQDMTQFLKANKDNNFGSKGSSTVQYNTTVQGNVLTNSEYETGLVDRNASYIYSVIDQYRQDRGL